MGAVHPGMARASFELERLELDEGRLLVSGWWSGVRGMRFVRPALLVDGRKMLATLEHKPWAVGSDGLDGRVPVEGQGRRTSAA